jgi:hypothetical protein
LTIPSLILAYGRSLTRLRPNWIRDASGGAYVPTAAIGTIPSGVTATVSGYLQIGGGSVSLRYGRENTRYPATLYTLASEDVKPGDVLTVTIESETRTYRVDSVHVPNDRPADDPLFHRICGLEEDMPRV